MSGSCCEFHKPGRCCDPDDCSPCCARCPDKCPLDVGHRGHPHPDMATVEGFAAELANVMTFIGNEFTSAFDGENPTMYVYRARDPEKMIFHVERFDENSDDMKPVGVFEVSVRKVEP